MNKTGALCPLCGGDLVERKTKQKKRIFYGCSNYPTCNFAIWEKPVPELCPNCNGLMVVPRVGQDPVCYQEVIAVQRSAEEKPQQNGTARRRVSRKSVSGQKEAKLVSEAPSTNGRRSTTVKKTAARKTRATTTRAKTATSRPAGGRKTTARARSTTTKKATTGRAKAVKSTKRSSAPFTRKAAEPTSNQ